MAFRIATEMEGHRVRDGLYGSSPGEPYGAFRCIAPGGIALAIIATNGEDPSGANWEHVSVSTAQRAPRWDEMCWVKDRFWEPEDTVVQYHPPKSLYVNCHPYTLHLWRHRVLPFMAPPTFLIGPQA